MLKDDREHFNELAPHSEASDYNAERGKPMPSLNHGTIQANLVFALKLYYRQRYRVVSELSLRLENWTSVPDICLLPLKPFDNLNDMITVEEPPLLTIEIISPTQGLAEITEKAGKYFEHGVRSCWLVLVPFRNIYVFSSPSEYLIFRHDEILRDAALDIEMPLDEIFV
jgi:Uma2 family endonuclease